MNNLNEVAFIFCTNKRTYCKECKRYINELIVPEGMTVSIIPVENAVSMNAGYNQAMKASNAKYKVYLHQDVFILNKNFISDFVKYFEQDESLGMLGVAGASRVPENAYVCTALDVGGCYSVGAFSGYGSIAVKPDTNNPAGLYQDTEYIDGMLMITSHDLPWDERIEGFHFYDLSQCMNFRNHGYKIAVVRQEELWTFHDFGPLDLATYDINRQKFCSLYDSYRFDEPGDGGKVYEFCKNVIPQLAKFFDAGEYNKARAIISDLEDVIYFNQDLLTMTFLLEIEALDKKGYSNKTFTQVKDDYLKLRLLLIAIEFSGKPMEILKNQITDGQVSVECVIVTAFHNIVDPDKFLGDIGGQLVVGGFCTEDEFINKVVLVKQYEKVNLAMP